MHEMLEMLTWMMWTQVEGGKMATGEEHRLGATA